MAPDSPIGGHDAMEPLDHPNAMDRMLSMTIGGYAMYALKNRDFDPCK